MRCWHLSTSCKQHIVRRVCGRSVPKQGRASVMRRVHPWHIPKSGEAGCMHTVRCWCISTSRQQHVVRRVRRGPVSGTRRCRILRRVHGLRARIVHQQRTKRHRGPPVHLLRCWHVLGPGKRSSLHCLSRWQVPAKDRCRLLQLLRRLQAGGVHQERDCHRGRGALRPLPDRVLVPGRETPAVQHRWLPLRRAGIKFSQVVHRRLCLRGRHR